MVLPTSVAPAPGPTWIPVRLLRNVQFSTRSPWMLHPWSPMPKPSADVGPPTVQFLTVTLTGAEPRMPAHPVPTAMPTPALGLGTVCVTEGPSQSSV